MHNIKGDGNNSNMFSRFFHVLIPDIIFDMVFVLSDSRMLASVHYRYSYRVAQHFISDHFLSRHKTPHVIICSDASCIYSTWTFRNPKILRYIVYISWNSRLVTLGIIWVYRVSMHLSRRLNSRHKNQEFHSIQDAS